MPRILVLIVLCLTSYQAHAQESSVREEFFARMRAQSDSVRTIRARFSQERSMAILQEPVRRSGDFFFVRPDRLALRFDRGDRILIDGREFRIRQGDNLNAGKTAGNPLMRQILSIVTSSVEGRFDGLAREFSLEVRREGAGFHLLLSPKRRSAQRFIRAIELDFAPDLSLSRMRIVEPQGDFTRYEFFEKQFNLAFGAEVFADGGD